MGPTRPSAPRRCHRCDEAVGKLASFCPRCGQSQDRTAEWLTLMTALSFGAATVLSVQLWREALGALSTALGPTGLEILDVYLRLVVKLGTVTQVPFTAVAAAIALGRLARARLLTRVLLSGALGLLSAAVQAALFAVGGLHWREGVVAGCLVAAALAGGVIGRPALAWCSAFPPFSWARGASSVQVNPWRFVLILFATSSWTVVAPWAVVGLFLAGLVVHGVRACLVRVQGMQRVPS